MSEVIIPKVGLTMEEALIISWLANEGDEVTAGQPLLELETEKTNVELPSPASGRLSRILSHAGETVAVGDVIGIIEP